MLPICKLQYLWLFKKSLAVIILTEVQKNGLKNGNFNASVVL